MKLKTLGGKPSDFPLSITVHELDGTEWQVPFICIGRTTLDWQPISLARLEKDANALIDQEEKLEAENARATKNEEAQETTPKKRKRIVVPHKEIAKNTEAGLKEAIAVVREVASGWELEEEFTDENIKQAIIRFPGIQAQLWNEYDARVKGNRRGN